jgi:hypothetical protein
VSIGSICPNRGENCALSKRALKKSKRRSKALPALGFAGVSLSMAGGACASTSEATANTLPTSQSHEIFLGEEEISDVSLSTFYAFDKENSGALPLAQQQRMAHGCACSCGCGCGPFGWAGGWGEWTQDPPQATQPTQPLKKMPPHPHGPKRNHTQE